MLNLLKHSWSPLLLLSIVIYIITHIEIILVTLGLHEDWYIYAVKVLSVVAWLMGAILAVKLTRILFWEGLIRNTIGRHPPRLIIQLGNLFIFLLAFSGLMAFTFHQSVTGFWTASGAIGIVVGFALRNLILDTFSGLAIQMERPFKVGDWISCHTRMGEFVGRVEETNWRTTRLWTTNRNIIIIPNSFLTTTVVSNFSMPDRDARFEMTFTLDFSVPTERAIRVLYAAAMDSVGPDGPLANPAPKIRANAITQYGVEYRLRYYLLQGDVTTSKVRHTIITKVTEHLRHAGLTLSYPRQDLFLTRMPWRQKDWNYPKDLVRQLSQISLFKVMRLEDIDFIADKIQITNLSAGQTIVTQGEEGDSMFILAEGIAEVFINTKENGQVKVAGLAPGTFFGEKSLLTGETRSATIICATDAVICEIKKSVISQLFERNEKIVELLSRAIIERDIQNQNTVDHLQDKDHEEHLEEQSNQFMKLVKDFFSLKA